MVTGRRARWGARGLTLIELLVTLVVFLAILAASLALGKGWLDANNVTKGQGLVQQGYSIAKTYAMQNPNAQTGDSPAAMLCLSGGVFSVYLGGACSGAAVWTGAMPSNTTVTANAATPSCFAFTNQGRSTAGGASCSTATSYTVTSGSSNVTKSFF